MSRARKAHGDKVILDEVTLSFLPGAKIGVVGPNGAGKSSVLKIMAGLDQPSNGEARLTPGLLGRDPHAGARAQRGEDGARQRRGGRRRDQGQARPVQRDLGGDGRAGRRLRRAHGRDGPAPGGHRRRRRLGPGLPARAGDGRPALPAAGRRRHRALRRRAPPRRAVQAAAPEARPAAPRRAHEPPRRRVGPLARAAPRGLPRRRRRGHARPVLHGQRRRVDPRARPRTRLPLRGQLLDLPREEAGPPARPGQEGRQALQAPRRGARLGPQQRQGQADQVQGPARAVRGDGGRGRPHPQARLRRDPDPAGPASRQQGHRGQGPQEGLRRPRPHRGPLLHPAAQRHRRASSARTVSARRPSSRRSSVSRRPTPARSTSARRSRSPTSTRAAAGSTRRRTSGRRSPAATTTSTSATSRSRRRAYVSQFGFKGPDQQKKAGVLSGGERNRLNLALDPQGGRQPAPPRRADQRPRRRDAGLARERAARLPGLRRGHQPRPVVPRPRRDAHPRLRGRRTRTPPRGTGSRATSSPTRRTRSSASARTRRVRTG